MGFLTRLLKTPDEDQEEGPDELDAEEKGLLMVPSLPVEERPAPTRPPEARGTDAEVTATPAQGGDLVEAMTEPVVSDGEEATEPTEESPQVQEATGEPVSAEAAAEEGSSDDALAMFRADTVQADRLPADLTNDLVDVSAADLLAEARSTRDTVLGGQAGKERAA